MEIIFTFRNTRNAVESEKELEAAGLCVRVMPRPSVLGQGCGICLRVDQEHRVRSEAVLQDAGIEVEGVYLRIKEKGKICYKSAGSAGSAL